MCAAASIQDSDDMELDKQGNRKMKMVGVIIGILLFVIILLGVIFTFKRKYVSGLTSLACSVATVTSYSEWTNQWFYKVYH